MLTTTADAIEAAFAAGRTGIIPAIENGYALGRDLATLDAFAARGVRYITLTHNGHNDLADAAIPRRGPERCRGRAWRALRAWPRRYCSA